MDKPILELKKIDNYYLVNDFKFYKKSTFNYYCYKLGMALHRYIYEYYNGAIEKDHIVIFKDNNHNNFNIDNLACITRSSYNRDNHMSFKNKCLKRDILRYKLEDKFELKKQ